MLDLLSMIMQVSNQVFLHLCVITQEFYENLNLLSYLDMFLVVFFFYPSNVNWFSVIKFELVSGVYF